MRLEAEGWMTLQFARAGLFCFASLALLPGCQHFLGGAGMVREDARIRQELAAAKASTREPPAQNTQERKGMSTAIQREPEGPAAAKKDAPPVLEPRPVIVKPLDPPPVQAPAEPLKGPKLLDSSRLPADGKKWVESGIPGVVVSASSAGGTDPAGLKPIAGQATGQPLPLIPAVEQKLGKREHAPFFDAFQSILEGRHQEAIRHLEFYDKGTQEFFLRLLPTLSIFVKNRSIDDLTPAETAVISDQLYGLLAMLRPRSELVVNKMCCCRRIRGYGSYEPLPENHAFLAGSAADRPGELVQLYVELKNFASEPTPDALFLTKLACTLELHNARGEKVWSYGFDRNETTHRRQARINDFYSNYSFYVPAIAPGAYQLTIVIADETNPELRRVARKSLEFRVTPVSNTPLPR